MYSKKSTVIFVPRCGVASCLILPTSPCESGPLQPHKHYVLPCYPWVACHFEAELVLIYTNCICLLPLSNNDDICAYRSILRKANKQFASCIFTLHTLTQAEKHSTNYAELSTHLCNLQSPLFSAS